MNTRTSYSFPTILRLPLGGAEPITCEDYAASAVSVQLLGLNLNVLFASGLLLPVFLHPGLEGLACSRVLAAERKRRNVGVGDVHLRGRIRWDDADERVGER